MSDYEGSRSEFLKLLAEMGEEPAFIARALGRLGMRSRQLLQACEAKRNELLKWPKFHLAALAQRVRGNWSRLGPMLAGPEDVALLEAFATSMPSNSPGQSDWLTSDRATLVQFVESGERFNRNWRTYVDGVDLESVNQPRRDFNQYYVLEKACGFGSEQVAEGFEPLGMIDGAYLYQRYPLLVLPSLA